MHIEPTSRCILSCPACPRTWFSTTFDRPFPKQDLDLDDLYNFLDCDSGRKIPSLTLNGNHGDPIYYPYLFDFITKFRNNKNFRIVTNGSHQKSEFWEKLKDCLTKDDTLIFSIDGLEHNNHLYRRNSDWNSIMSAVDIMSKSNARLIWKTLIFKYNENDIEKIKQVAEGKGFKFQADITSRFGDESLKPVNTSLILSDRLYKDKWENLELEPRCHSEHFISADGYYWPCCMISNYYVLHKTWLWKERQQWSIKHRTLDQLQNQLDNTAERIKNEPKNAHDVCKMHCKKGQFDYPWASM